ncbi:dynamin family protein [Dialister succinatiphilus]|uniref:dynamin family protein n=1 Tax=Dialister succinatiphilus TaxID=487173 RepID=UPI004025A2EB
MEQDDKVKSQFDLLKKLVVLKPDNSSLMASAHKIKKMIKEGLPKALEMEAPPNLPALCFDLEEVYEQFEDFLVFRQLIGKNIVSLGGGFSTGKSSFLNGMLSENTEEKVQLLPTDTAASTAVPTYLLHAEGEEKIDAVNMFDSRISGLTASDVQEIGHDFEKDNPGVSLGQLLQRMFIATPLQKYEHIAFLDTPGYSKPEMETYSARTDEQIAREQLNHSHFILWFVNGALITAQDIHFLKGLDSSIPKAVILNKADKVLTHGLDEYKSVIAGIKEELMKNGIAVKGVWGYTRSPRWKEKIGSDIDAIHHLLDELNEGKGSSRFGHDFMKLFVECRKYYRRELADEESRLKRVNQAMLLSDNEDVRANLNDSKLILTSRIGRLKEAMQNLETERGAFFDQIRKVAAEVHIDIPEPSELELAEENATDPASILAQLMEEKGKKEDPVMAEKLQLKLHGIDRENCGLPGSRAYEDRLFQVLQSKLSHKK